MTDRLDKSAAALIARVAANVTRLRSDRELTVAELAERSGLHPRHLQKMEAGELNATMETIANLARGLEVTPETLFAQPLEEPPKRPRRGGRPRGGARRARR